jgi:hypothetical protein
LWSILLTVSFCAVFFNFPLHLRYLSFNAPNVTSNYCDEFHTNIH